MKFDKSGIQKRTGYKNHQRSRSLRSDTFYDNGSQN